MIPGLVSVVIPVYNRAEMVKQAVDSVLSQTYRHIEIIIVDDGSTDETVIVAEQLEKEHHEVIRIVYQDNAGPGSAREAGRQLARGEFIQYLDSDDLLLPRKFELQVAALREHPDCGVAYGITRLIDARGQILQEPYKWTGRKLDSLFPSLLVDRWWNTHTPLWRQAVCQRIGPWPEGRMGEDWLYDSKAAALGTALAFVEEPVAATRQHGEGRLTAGELTPEKSKDIAYLIIALHQAARQAKVDPLCPEMRHFSRWAFLEARRAGTFGFTRQANDCLAIAREIAPTFDPKMLLIAALAKLMGWQTTGKLCRLMEKTVPCRLGNDIPAKSNQVS